MEFADQEERKLAPGKTIKTPPRVTKKTKEMSIKFFLALCYCYCSFHSSEASLSLALQVTIRLQHVRETHRSLKVISSLSIHFRQSHLQICQECALNAAHDCEPDQREKSHIVKKSDNVTIPDGNISVFPHHIYSSMATVGKQLPSSIVQIRKWRAERVKLVQFTLLVKEKD